MNETTTDAVAQDAGVTTTTQPEEQPAEAVTTPDSEPKQPEGTDEPGAQPENSDEPETKTYTPEWLESKGIDPNDPDALEKALNMAFNSEKLMSKSRQQTSALEKGVSGAPTDAAAPLSKTDLLVGAMLFKQNNAVTSEQDEAMGDYLGANPQKMSMLQHGLLTYEDIYAMSGASALGKPDPQVLKKQGGQEALQQLRNKQTATAPRGNASQGTPPPADDPILSVLESD